MKILQFVPCVPTSGFWRAELVNENAKISAVVILALSPRDAKGNVW